MQHYDINIPAGGAREIQVQGDYVYYLSGSAGGADSTITLRDVSGSDTVLLKPGQAFRLGYGGKNVRWIVGNHAGAGDIEGVLLMGEGEFSDNRISGSVEVTGTVKTQEVGLEYGGSYSSFGVTLPTANLPVQVIAPASNVNGLVVHQSIIAHSDAISGVCTLLAKETAPTGIGDGDVLNVAASGAVMPSIIQSPISIPPGKGLYVIANAIETGGTQSILYTLL